MSLSSHNHLPQPQQRSGRWTSIWRWMRALLVILLYVSVVLSWFPWMPTARPWNVLPTVLTMLLVLALYPYQQSISPFRRFVLAVMVAVLAAWIVLDLVFPVPLLLDNLLVLMVFILALAVSTPRQVVPTKNPEQRDDLDTSR